mmetsp:Transcript_44626/g.128051  ORF Transcript_44626/g.128051 Transcript_44626/m.128051 type:complete len:142 (-) Transcript_44626:64-489(-)
MEDEGPPPGPNIDVASIEITPAAECPFEEQLNVVMQFSTDTPLENYCWRFSYTVDTSKRRKIIDLGCTEYASYPPGLHAMSFSAERFDIAGVPEDVRTQVNGLLAAVLTGPSGEEAMTVNMVVQIYVRDGMLQRYIFNPLE